jgi:hypothetical protein
MLMSSSYMVWFSSFLRFTSYLYWNLCFTASKTIALRYN